MSAVRGAIFLTGATGFLGSHLLPGLASGGRRVVCLCRTKPPGSPSHSVEYVSGDLLATKTYAPALSGCDTVIHLAAVTGKERRDEYFRVNRDGTQVLIAAAQRAGVSRFLHVSTIAAKFRNQSHYYYAQSKLQAESIVAQSGLRWTVVRPTMILGRNAPVLLGLERLATLPIVPVFGNGRTRVQPVWVDDLAACLREMPDDDSLCGCTLEVGGPEVLTIEDLILRIRRARGGRDARVIHLPARPVAVCLGWVEKLLGPLLPVTAGQLASFTNDGTVDRQSPVTAWQECMKGVDEMLQWVSNGQATA